MSWSHIVRVFPRSRIFLNIHRGFSNSSNNTPPSSSKAQISNASSRQQQLLPKVLQTQTTSSMPSEAKDIIMYRFEKPRFYQLLSFFAVAQFIFWAMLSYSSLSLVDVPVSKDSTGEDKNKSSKTEDNDLPLWRKVNLGQDKYKWGLGIGSFLMGYGILFMSWTYILRSVRYLVLRKDRNIVAFVTYTPFGKNRIMDVPLSDISAAGSRSGGTTQMPIKIKNKWLFYMLDLKEGQFPQPKLFDQTVALQRKF